MIARIVFVLLIAVTSAASPVALRVDSYLTRLEGYGYSGSVLLEVDGQVLLRKAYGLANQPAGVPYTTETVFDIGSMAKTFTAAAILRLEEQGKLRLSDSIAAFLPNVPEDKKAFTVAQLLSHTSGLPGDVPSNGGIQSAEEVGRDEVVSRILALPLEQPPGTGPSYSNGGFVLLAAIVEKAGGQPYRDFVRNEIWTRAGLKNTRFWGEPGAGTVAAGHDGIGNVVFDPAKGSPTTWIDLGGGQVLSTLDDLRRWIHALQSDKVLPAKQRQAMFSAHTDPIDAAKRFRLGYAWFLNETARGTRLVLHGGDSFGTGAELVWWIDEKIVYVSSTNVRHDVYPTRNRVDRVLRPLLFDERAEPEVPAFVRADATPPDGMIGTYRLESGGTLHVFTLLGRLYVGARGQDATALLASPEADVEKERAWRSTTVAAAIMDLMRGKPEAFDVLAGSTATRHGFRDAVRDEIAGIARSALAGVDVIGSFQSGFPVGGAPIAETTLLRLRFKDAEAFYAIRWNGRSVGATDISPMRYAAMVPLQLMLDRSWAGWNIITEKKLAVDFVPPDAIRVRVGDKSVTGKRVSAEGPAA